MKTVLITGASRGIGSAIAVAFAKAGYNLVLNYNNSEEKAAALAKVLCESYNVSALAIKADVSNQEQVHSMVDKSLEVFGKIDCLVNNAGIAQQKLFTEITQDDWNNMINVNLSGVFNVTQAVLKNMLFNHNGSIINISSMWGQTGASCEVHYSTAKAGIIGMTKALAKEVAPSGITVNCICPGVIATDIMSGFDETAVEQLIEETPIGRLGTPKDVADAVVFMASEKASFITGQVLGVNGGMVI